MEKSIYNQPQEQKLMENVMHQLSYIKASLGGSDNNIPFKSFLIF